MPRRKDMDQRHRLLLKGLAQGKSQSQAALEAGYSPTTARVQAYRLIRTPAFLQRLARAMDKTAMSDARLLADLEAALRATETKFFAHKGAVMEAHDVINWDARLRALEIALRLKRYLRAGEDDPPPPPVVPIHLYLGLPPGPADGLAPSPVVPPRGARPPALPGRIVEETPDHAG